MLSKLCVLFQNSIPSRLYSKHVPIVPVLVESWSGQVNSGSLLSNGLVQNIKNILKNYMFVYCLDRKQFTALKGYDFQIKVVSC